MDQISLQNSILPSERENEAHDIVRQKVLFVVYLLSIVITLFFPSLKSLGKYVLLPVSLVLMYRYPIFDFLIPSISIFDNEIGTMLFGKFTILLFYLAALFFKYMFRRKMKLRPMTLLVIVLASVYFMMGIGTYRMNSIKYVIILLCTGLISYEYDMDEENLGLLLFALYMTAMLQAVTLSFGLTGTIESAERTTGIGFRDPNYASAICVFGFCGLVNLSVRDGWKKALQLLGCILLILGVFRSGSRSGMLVILAAIVMRLFMIRGASKKVRYLLTLAVVGAIGAYLLGSGLVRIPNADNLLRRWTLTFSAMEAHDYGDATAHRATTAAYYWNYFIRQSPLRVLFGGNVVGSKELIAVGHGYVTHNVYLDYLLAFGFVFSAVFVYAFLKRTLRYYRAYRETDSTVFLSIAEIKVAMLLIGATLAMLQVYQWWFLAII